MLPAEYIMERRSERFWLRGIDQDMRAYNRHGNFHLAVSASMRDDLQVGHHPHEQRGTRLPAAPQRYGVPRSEDQSAKGPVAD